MSNGPGFDPFEVLDTDEKHLPPTKPFWTLDLEDDREVLKWINHNYDILTQHGPGQQRAGFELTAPRRHVPRVLNEGHLHPPRSPRRHRGASDCFSAPVATCRIARFIKKGVIP